MAASGFALSFKCRRTDNEIIVTGILSHRDGHSEETELSLPSDTSGSKNAVQAVGSSTSYGKRYTASSLLNLTTVGADDDGRAGGTGELISIEQLDELLRRASEVGADLEKFCRHMKVASLPQLPARRYDEAMKALDAKVRAK